MHTFLSGAGLLVTDSGTMTTEGAVLGIPVIRCNSYLGHDRVGIFRELESKYGLIFSSRDADQALKKAVELVQIPDTRTIWEQKRECLLQDKIDVTSFMIWFVENYPESIDSAKKSFCVGNDYQV
jgi:predicted glycosyltransferase